MESGQGNLEQQQNSQTEERYYELLALSRVSAALSGLWDLDAILQVALDNVLSVMNGATGGILLLDESSKTLSYRVFQGLSDEYVKEVRISLGEGIAGRVAQTGKAILLEDASGNPSVASLDLVSTEGLKAFISVPLRTRGKILGVINIASHEQRRFSRNDMHLLYSIGDQLGVAIEQAKLYERLRQARERYRHLARQTLVAQEDERKRIAGELHDETAQDLSGLTLQLQALVDMAELSGKQDTDFIARLKKVQSLAVLTHTEIRRLIADLRPALLDTLGLIPAVRQLAENNLRSLGINVSVETEGMNKRLPPEVETGLYRIIQGAIGNIVKHSGAKNVTISLKCHGNELALRVVDDGIGFDVSKITDIEEGGRGRGVFSMRERLMLLGGVGWIESQPGRGTAVCGKLPLSDEDVQDKSTSS